jgi:pyruvate/2-oxoglutarate dehydrogenase complex dihydrolipoamide acyltransferase (E2) component
MKKRAAQHKARHAAIALKKQQQASKRKGQQRRKREKGGKEAIPAVAETAAVTEEKPAVTATVIPVAATPEVPPPVEQLEESAETTVSDMQDILSSVFMDDEADSRHAVLMRDVEVTSAEELLAFAQKIADKLRALSETA